MACGFSDGTTLLLQGDLARSPLLPPPAPLLIQPGEDEPSAVTALHFSRGHVGKGGSSAGQVGRRVRRFQLLSLALLHLVLLSLAFLHLALSCLAVAVGVG